MNKLNFLQKFFSTNLRVPSIKFIGKRSKMSHHTHSPHLQQTHLTPNVNSTQSTSNSTSLNTNLIEQIKRSLSVSPIATLHMRPKLTQEEIEFINNGGPVAYKDWSKIKVKSKKQI